MNKRIRKMAVLAVLFGTTAMQAQVVIDSSVYGGGNMADVGGATVHILNGTVHQNIFGGGRGRAEQREGDVVTVTKVAPVVNGPVTVNIGTTDGNENPTYSGAATIGGSVYGCNDAEGTPKQNVFVNIYGTAQTAKQVAGYDNTANDREYALKEVFGGGNRADYSPNLTTGTPYQTTVTIYGCDNTVQDVYGGGNAAAVTKCATVVWGGRHDRVFAGGNGYSATGNHTDPTAANYNPGADIGSGGTSLTIDAGIINQVFGGSNEKGDIEGPIAVTVAHSSTRCGTDANVAEQIGEFFGGSNKVTTGTNAHPVNITTTIECGTGTFTAVYGGSNQADIIGSVTLNIKGGTITDVYGGSKGVKQEGTEGNSGYVAPVPADIKDARDGENHPKGTHGKVTLNLYGGTVTNAFGGSNQNGNIEGSITVNVLDHEGSCPLDVTNIYGAGNVTRYTPNVDTLTSPLVNLMHIKQNAGIRGNVYGGGLGETAIVTARPRLNVGYDNANMSGLIPTGYPVELGNRKIYVSGSIYGGGKAAPVTGRTHVRMNPGPDPNTPTMINQNVFGGGDEAEVSGRASIDMMGGIVTQNLYGGGNQAAVGAGVVSMIGGSADKVFGGGNNVTEANKGVGDAVTVTINGGSISSGLYGGCNTSGTVGGNITLNVTTGNIGAAAVGTSGNEGYVPEKRADIYGGGYGQNTTALKNVEVTLGGKTTGGTLVGPTVYGDVYGGSALGNVGGTAANTDYHTYVTLNYGTIHGTIYGGALGQKSPAIESKVWAPVKVTVNDGTVENIFGCNNSNGGPQQIVEVMIAGGTVSHDVFGGGNEAAYNSPDASIASPLVTIKGSSHVEGDVYGGGNQAAVTGSTAVKLQQGATIDGNVYGGGNEGEVSGSSSVTVEDE